MERCIKAICARAAKLGIKAESHFWSEAEIEILKNNFLILGPKKCEELLPNRKSASIAAKASSLGLKYSNLHCNYNHWTKEEDNILRTYFYSEGSSVYKRIEGRDRSSCSRRAHNLGLITKEGIKRWSEEEDCILFKYYTTLGAKGCLKYLNTRDVNSIQARAMFLKLKFEGKVDWVKSKRIKCIETNIIYNSPKEAAEDLNLKVGLIRAAANGQQKSCGGYHWKYLEEN